MEKAEFVYEFKVTRKIENKVRIKASSLDEAKDRLWQTKHGKYKEPKEKIEVVCERFFATDNKNKVKTA